MYFRSLLLAMCLIPIWLGAQSQTVLLVDDFETFPLNAFGAINPPPFYDNSGGTTILREVSVGSNSYGQSGQSLHLSYDVDGPNRYAGQVIPLPSLDLSPFAYLSFRVRSLATAPAYLQVELKRNQGSQAAKVAVKNFLPEGIDGQWRKVVIPLANFWNLDALTQVSDLVFVVDHYSSEVNGAATATEIWLDDVVFGSYEPGYVQVDHFDDLLGSNATGGNLGTFSPSGGATQYQYALNPTYYGAHPNSLEIDYQNYPDPFGGVCFILGGGADGWTQTARDLTATPNLHLALRATQASSNPGNVKLELKTPTQTSTYRVFGIPDTGFCHYDIPFQHFSPPLNASQVQELVITFESGWQSVLSGTLYVDDISFRSSTYQAPGDTPWPTPGTLLIDGTAPTQTVQVSSSAQPTFAIATPSSDPLIESMRLEYRLGCEDEWRFLARTYAPLSDSFEVVVNADELPQDLPLEVRACAERFDGSSACASSISLVVNAPSPISDELFRAAYEVLATLRSPSGVYRDATILSGAQYHPASVATTGAGLIALCIADSMGWESQAEAKVLHTLKAMHGMNAGFRPERNLRGLFRHFIDLVTGEQAWESEFSSIDSGILTAGALFAKAYFADNDSIAMLADGLFLSTDWASCLADTATGAIYLMQDLAGVGSGLTLPYNEYMIVAWLANHDLRFSHDGARLWDLHYADPAHLPPTDTCGYSVLTDQPGAFISNFIPQFCYYYCHYYATDPAYQAFFTAAYQADRCWWEQASDAASCYIWGFGAGSAPDSVGGYHADHISYHPGEIASPHIMGGFIPLADSVLQDLVALYQSGRGLYQLPDQGLSFLWRFSTLDPAWAARDVQGIDYSTMLFGLASHSQYLGPAFFPTYNDFAFPTSSNSQLRFVLPDTLCLQGDSSMRLPLYPYILDLNTPAWYHQLDLLDAGGLSLRIDTPTQTLVIDPATVGPGIYPIVLRTKNPQGQQATDSLVLRQCLSTQLDRPSPAAPRIFPNPTAGSLAYRLPQPMTGTLQVCMYSLSGQEMFAQRYPLQAGQSVLRWQCPPQMIPGLYLLSIQGPHTMIWEKIFLIPGP